MSTDFREARQAEREAKVADRMDAIRQAAPEAKKQFVQALRRPIEIGQPIPGMANAGWKAPVASPAMQQEHFDAYGWSMSSEDQEMVAAGLNPNEVEDCHRWQAMKKGEAYVPTPRLSGAKAKIGEGEDVEGMVERVLMRALRKIGLVAPEPDPPPPASSTIDVDGWD